ncbi:MAG TPA: hypothetical protein VH815_04120 [Acidobacteriota bacterium]
MKLRWIALLLIALPINLIAQSERGPFARIAVLRPNDGKTVDFESGYIRHLEWHRQAKDSWAWFGWNIWAGERQRWFVYATFGHTAASFDNPVNPIEDERDTIINVIPNCQFVENGIYEYLPQLSRGTGEPTPTPRVEFTTVTLKPDAEKTFENALAAQQSKLQTETLWYRMIAGGSTPRYVRLRPRQSLSEIIDGRNEQGFDDQINKMIEKITIEILNLKPSMSYGVTPSAK